MAQITYTFNGQNLGTTNFTVTTGNTAQTYNINGRNVLGYAITGISGTFNGQNITSLIGGGGQYNPGGTSNIVHTTFPIIQLL